MTRESAIRIFAGSLNLLSLVLFLWVGPLGLLLAAFISLNLIQSAFTGFCPAERVLAALGVGEPRSANAPESGRAGATHPGRSS